MVEGWLKKRNRRSPGGGLRRFQLLTTDEARRERARRYLGAEFGDAYFESTRAEPDLTFALHPRRWASVDYSKML